MPFKSNSDDEFRDQIAERRSFAFAGSEFVFYVLSDGRCVADAKDVLSVICGMGDEGPMYDPDFRAEVRALLHWIYPDAEDWEPYFDFEDDLEQEGLEEEGLDEEGLEEDLGNGVSRVRLE